MKKRIISAILMVLIFVPFVVIGKIPFAIFMTILGLLALKEMFDLEKNIPLWCKVVGYFIGLILILNLFGIYNFNLVIDYRMIGTLFLLCALSLVIKGDLKKYNYKDCLWLFCIVFLIGTLFNNLIHLRNIGLYDFIYIFLIATMTDTFALFTGKAFGKHKLSPNISPNKTIEGSLGGSIIGTIISSLFYLFFINKSVNILLLIIITFVLTIIGQLGDLFFSSIKRHHDVKDFSNLIPGHGGILDRLDSSLFIAYGYLILTMIIG